MKYPGEGMTMVIVSANSRAELGKESDFFEMTKEKRRRIFGGFLFCLDYLKTSKRRTRYCGNSRDTFQYFWISRSKKEVQK